MMRIALFIALIGTSCQSPSPDQKNKRTDRVEEWISPGDEVVTGGFSLRNQNSAYASPYAFVREFYIDLDAESDYAVLEGDFDHRCGSDAKVSREFAIVGAKSELFVARSFEGTLGFDRVPEGLTKLLVLVLTDRSCRISKTEFSIVKAKLTRETPEGRCKQQSDKIWDGHACVKSPKTICEEIKDRVFVDGECLKQMQGSVPQELFSTAWIGSGSEDETRWILQFDANGSGLFGFRSEGVTIRSGKIAVGSDVSIEEPHVVISILTVEDLPDNQTWQEGGVYYCRFRIADGEEEEQLLDLICSQPGLTSLPEASVEIDAYRRLDPEDSDLSAD